MEKKKEDNGVVKSVKRGLCMILAVCIMVSGLTGGRLENTLVRAEAAALP